MADRAKRCSRVIKSSYIYSLLISQPLFPPRSLRSSFPFRVHPAIRLFFVPRKQQTKGIIFIVPLFYALIKVQFISNHYA